ncbi:MAG TPA: prolipoprotein diacylglyceryl transferase family protein [Candidatus Binatia bacterium]|nr:prolipoprotein diacylglyceryl transferase family protein [Candidatus Binatia bacterium]
MEPSTVYLALWTFGCVCGVVAGLAVLHRRDAFGASTVLALGVAWGGLIVGSKLQARIETMPPGAAVLIPWDQWLTPGRRIPLGLLTGALLAAAWCRACRAPWRETGDALAVAASVMIPIGRVGCLSYGCCMGTVCGPITMPFCRLFSPGTPASLAPHPLPLYFAVASLLTLGVLLGLLRRGAPAGSLLLAFCILRPLTKLALEPLRAEVVESILMEAIPLVVLALAASIALRLAWLSRGRQLPRAAVVPDTRPAEVPRGA